ncbi:membrane protein [Capsulimonas corticalis]|uniref:Membrane protein n=2 Tax=Capsulimonas corticalis TaxID=2219043 RepID=A0A402CS64_9BACT|nr:membrane protein [Capsulimonas corticalis]
MRDSALWGMVLAAAVALAAIGLHALPRVGIFSALILSIVLGMAVGNTVAIPEAWRPGIQFSLKRVLRLAIILLGLQLSFTQVGQIGVRGMAVVAGSLLGTFLFTVWLGARLGVERKLTQLIAAGSSICGASAVIAANVVTRGRDEDVAYGVAVVTVFGSVSMFVYPLLPRLLHLTPMAFGLWTGASIHEVAQVIAAAFQDGAVSGQFGTISKLARVMLLAPMVLALGVIDARRNAAGAKLNPRSIPIPWFVLGFVAMIGVNTWNIIPMEIKTTLIAANQFLLALSLAAMGLETSFAKLKRAGARPMLLGAGAWLFISAFSYLLVRLFY